MSDFEEDGGGGLDSSVVLTIGITVAVVLFLCCICCCYTLACDVKSRRRIPRRQVPGSVRPEMPHYSPPPTPSAIPVSPPGPSYPPPTFNAMSGNLGPPPPYSSSPQMNRPGPMSQGNAGIPPTSQMDPPPPYSSSPPMYPQRPGAQDGWTDPTPPVAASQGIAGMQEPSGLQEAINVQSAGQHGDAGMMQTPPSTPADVGKNQLLVSDNEWYKSGQFPDHELGKTNAADSNSGHASSPNTSTKRSIDGANTPSVRMQFNVPMGEENQGVL